MNLLAIFKIFTSWTQFKSFFFNWKTIRVILAIFIVGYLVYVTHIKPMNFLKEENKKFKEDLTELKLKLSNTEQYLQKCKQDLNTSYLNLELCNLKDEAYGEVNTEIKDTSNEGYLIF